MSIRSDIWVNWSASPRIIWVTAPSVVLTIQDLVDTCRSLEAELENMAFDYLINAVGKDSLGGGIYVGVTATLQNAQIAFEARTGPDYIQCSVTGGNILALDSSGTEISAIYPTAFTQVIISLSASATLQQLPEIQYSSFQNAVSIDPILGLSGTAYPIGSTSSPSISLDFAYLIAESRGFSAFKFINDYSVDVGDGILNGFTFLGEAAIRPTLTITSSAVISNSFFQNIKLTGYLNGLLSAVNCSISNTTATSGNFMDCEMGGSIVIGALPFQLVNCYAGDTALLVINCSGGSRVTLQDWSGDVTFTNARPGQQILINSDGGTVIFDSTCSSATARITGISKVTNNSSTLVVIDETVSSEVWSARASSNNVVGSMGQKLNAAGTAGDPWTADLSLYGPGTAGQILHDIPGQISTIQGGLTTAQATMLLELYKVFGLDPSAPLIVTETARSAGTIKLF